MIEKELLIYFEELSIDEKVKITGGDVARDTIKLIDFVINLFK